MGIKTIESFLLLALAIVFFSLVSSGVTTRLMDQCPAGSCHVTIIGSVVDNNIVLSHNRGGTIRSYEILLNGTTLFMGNNLKIGNNVVLPYQSGVYSMVDTSNNEILFYGVL